MVSSARSAYGRQRHARQLDRDDTSFGSRWRLGAGALMSATIPPATIGLADFGSYTILYLGVAASWAGIPIFGGAALASAGVLANDGQLDVWIVIVVAAVAAWTGGCVGYRLGARVGAEITSRPGRWQRQRRHAMRVGERIYRRWGPLGVLVMPTWVAGALRMPRNSFLAWNAIAAVVSSLVIVFGAYAIASAVLGLLSAGQGLIVLIVGAVGVAGIAVAAWRRRASRAR